MAAHGRPHCSAFAAMDDSAVAVKRPQLPKAIRKKRQKLDERLSERQKTHVRRNNNRQAAQNLRNRKRGYEDTLLQRAEDLREENASLDGRVRELTIAQEDLRNKLRIIAAVVAKVRTMEQQQEEEKEMERSKSLVNLAGEPPSPVPQQRDAALLLPSPTCSLDLSLDFSEGDPFGLVPLADDGCGGGGPPLDDSLAPAASYPPIVGPSVCGREDDVPQHQVDTSTSEASLESAAFKRSPLPSGPQNLSALCCMLGITSFLNPMPGRSAPSSSLPSATSPLLDAPPSEFGLPQPSVMAPSQHTIDTGFLDPLLGLVDPLPSLATLFPDFAVPFVEKQNAGCNSLLCV